jgi:hypothetical protein
MINNKKIRWTCQESARNLIFRVPHCAFICGRNKGRSGIFTLLLRARSAKAAGLSFRIQKRTLAGAGTRKLAVLLKDEFNGYSGHGYSEHYNGNQEQFHH